MPRRPSPPTEPPKALRTYGCQTDPELVRSKLGAKAQFFYNQWAFANPNISVNFGAPPRFDLFWDIADVLVPGYFTRDPWTDRMINALCYNEWVGIAGCGGCVDGRTRLLNPITGEQPTFEFLHRNDIAPVVMTLDGPRRAEVPYIKGVDELFEIRLSDGSSFCVTGEHRVLTPQGFVSVSSLVLGQQLFSYAPSPQESTSARDLSIHGQGALGSLKKERDFQENCFPDCRLYGEQLHDAQEVYRESAPRHNGAQERTRGHLNWGTQACEVLYNHPWSQSCLPSNLGLENQGFRTGILGSPRCGQEIAAPDDHWSQFVSQFSEVASLRGRGGERERGFSHKQNSCDAFHSTSGLVVALSKVTSISATGKRIFYDISVPGPEHYFAEGAIHHNSGKTHNVTGFAVVWWLCDPLHSSVIICSTTSKALRKRNWANIQKLHALTPDVRIGNFVDSRMVWQMKKGDDLNAIAGIAVEEGDTKASGDKIKGTHTKRQMVLVNEANSVNGGIWEACANLYSYPEQCGGEFILAAEANPSSWLDEFGKFTEPDKGVASVNVDIEEWETKPQINGKKGICVRFDVEKTPNLDYPADRPINKHIPSRERAERCMRSPHKDSPLYWSNERGFPPPEGLNKNVFSETALTACGAYDKHSFTGNRFEIIGAFDPSRGGDEPMLRFGAMGELASGDMGIEWMKPIVIPVNVSLKNPIDYQILERVRQECEKVSYRNTVTSCPPQNLGIDATGGGADLCDIFNRHWSFAIMRIGFGESPSNDQCSHEDVRPANEVYKNKRAEMYFRTRSGLDSGQIKGVDQETAREMCTIEYDDSKPLRVITSKQDYKAKFKKSPDKTDSGIILSEVARRKGFKIRVQGQSRLKYEDTSKSFEAAQAVYSDVGYSSENDQFGISIQHQDAYEAIGAIE